MIDAQHISSNCETLMEDDTLTAITDGRYAEIPIYLAISEGPLQFQESFGSSMECTATRSRIWQVPKVICWDVISPGRASQRRSRNSWAQTFGIR